jgi:hypothetical protein
MCSTAQTYEERLRHVDDLLSGEIAIGLHLEYLYRNRNIDMLLLKNTKVCMHARGGQYGRPKSLLASQ